MAITIRIKRNDTRPIQATLKNPDGSNVNLTDCTVNFIMSNNKPTVLINRSAEIIDATNGKVRFSFVKGETSTSGTMRAEFEVTYPNGIVETFPNKGYITVSIERDLADANSNLPSSGIDGGDYIDIVLTQVVDGGSFTSNDFTVVIDGGGF